MLHQEWKLSEAVLVAKEEGMEEGAKKALLKVAKTMRNDGIDVDTTARLTGLTVDDILWL